MLFVRPQCSPARPLRWAMLMLCILAISLAAAAEDKAIHLKLPKRTKPTPVQQLNRDGVKAVDRHEYEKARKLFYKAYLLDPNDPFTLNNLGYISELEGDVDRAQRYYDLAQQQSSDAAVDLASERDIRGKAVSKVAGNANEAGMQVNRMNIAAISLLTKDRAPEADLVLQRALALDPHNPFTLNNMGYTKEKEGELESALSYYHAAANAGSRDPVIVSINREWRGKAISDVAAGNASKLRKEISRAQSPAALVARLNLQGVSAMNRNDRRAARNYFQQAYDLDPKDAFTLNNMGFLSELDGDRETADFYYEKAREARRNNAKVTVATRADAEGKRVAEVAETSGAKVDERMQQDLEIKRRQGGPIELRRRDGKPAESRNSNSPEASPQPPAPGAVAQPQPIPPLPQ